MTTREDFVYANAGNTAVLGALEGPLGRLLDLGCGAGDNARRLAGRFSHATGVTFSAAEAEAARTHFDRVVTHDLEQPLPADLGTFDSVVASHVLEHLRRPEALLASLRDHLAPRARVVVALPNLLHYSSRLSLLRGRFQYEEHGLMDRTHLRWFTFESGRELLERAGYTVDHAWVDGTFPLWKLRAVLPTAAVRAIETTAGRSRPGLFGAQLLYLAHA